MFGFLRRRKAEKKAELDYARMRIELQQILKVLTAERDPDLRVRFMASVGSHIRRVLEHRFGYAHEAFIHGDDDLRNEELRIDKLPRIELELLAQRVKSESIKEQKDDEWLHQFALTILAGWLECKVRARKADSVHALKEARDHEELYFSHVRNTMRIIRGEQPVTSN